MDISNAYKQHHQILSTQAEIAEVKQELKVVGWAYKLAFIGTFVVYLVFIWMMYVSDLWGFSSWLAQNMTETFALIIYIVLAVTLPLAMALIKEIGYKHFAKYPNPKIMIVLIVGILALAGVVYESISSSSQQQHISHSSAENSKTFEAISQTGDKAAPVSSASLSSLIAAAQQKVARCEEKLKAGKEKHCEGDKAKLQGYLDSEQRAFDAAERVSVAALETKTKAIQDLKEDSFKPVYKAIRDSFGVTIATGVMIVMVFISVIFEVSHLLLILFEGQKRQRLTGLKQSLINQEADYMQATGKTFKTEDFNDDSILKMDDVREQSPSPIGFGMPAHAFKYQQREQENKNPVGFTPWTNEKPRGKSSTWNRELSKSGIDSPADGAMNRQADQAQIERIVKRGLGTQEHQFDMPLESPHSDNPHAPLARVGTDEAYQHASDAPAGSMVGCPQCGTEFKKRNQQHRFCKKECRFTWHNERDPKKQDFLKQRNMAV
ncbi:MAG: hypothetical protein ACPGSM_19105 [Thiolinea sp.]